MRLRDLSSGCLFTCFLNGEIKHDLLERYKIHTCEMRNNLKVWPKK